MYVVTFGSVQRAAAAALTYNVDVARSAIAGSLDAWSWALELATLTSPGDLPAVTAKHANRQYRCLAAQSHAYGELVDWAVDEFLDHDAAEAATAVKDQDQGDALLLRLME